MPSPNIIHILCDDIGYNDLGCYGQKVIPTPRLDQLAAQSMRFTQCYTGSPICAPSRSVLMTGRHSGHTRVRDNFGIIGGVGDQKRVPLEPEDTIIPERLKTAGYITGIRRKSLCRHDHQNRHPGRLQTGRPPAKLESRPQPIAQIENDMKTARTDSPNWPIGVKESHG